VLPEALYEISGRRLPYPGISITPPGANVVPLTVTGEPPVFVNRIYVAPAVTTPVVDTPVCVSTVTLFGEFIQQSNL
jgi:hypothetical protein